MQRDTYAAAETDRDGHLRACPGRRAPWQLSISDTDLPIFDA